MDSDRRTLEQAAREFEQYRAQAWRDAADCAEIRDKPALAIYFRNLAWVVEHGEWLSL